MKSGCSTSGFALGEGKKKRIIDDNHLESGFTLGEFYFLKKII